MLFELGISVPDCCPARLCRGELSQLKSKDPTETWALLPICSIQFSILFFSVTAVV